MTIALGCQFLIERARRGRRAPPLGNPQNSHKLDAPVEVEGQDVARAHGLRWLVDAHTIDADLAGGDDIGGQRARLHETGEP